MTKSTITREERIQSLYDLKIGQVLNQNNIESIKILARMALAAMDSEPVYQVFEPSDGRWVDVDDEEEMIRLRSIGGEARTLYTAPPLPASGVDVVYQLWSAGIGQWVECDKQRFDAHSNLTAQRRILYSHAQPTVDSEPVAWRWRWSDDAEGYWRYTEEQRETHGSVTAQPLYRHAQPAPENCVTAEHRRVIEMLLNVCGAAFELADDSCQQDVDGEECHVVPDDAFQKLSDALDEIENTLPTEDIDRPDVFLAWSAMPRASLKSLLQAQPAPVVSDFETVLESLDYDVRCNIRESEHVYQASKATYDACRAAMIQAGNSPVIPDGMLKIGYMFITAEGGTAFSISDVPVPGMALAGPVYAPAVKAGWQQNAPQNIPEIIPGWIPVSERMPENDVSVLTFDGMYKRVHHAMYGHWQCWEPEKITHWMPLPAAPQEVPDGK
ncbi:MAG: DUF551 domain-containing protein [Klebsiella grimontii]|nr:DUF551 domain-containing protein [Klebsiella grimontii]